MALLLSAYCLFLLHRLIEKDPVYDQPCFGMPGNSVGID